MASNKNKSRSLYPQVEQSNPDSKSPFFSKNYNSSSSSLYPTIKMDDYNSPRMRSSSPSAPPEPNSYEETLITVPGAIAHLVDRDYSIELACGDFSIIRLWQDKNIVAILARVAREVQWPLMKDAVAVKVDDSHYFFSLTAPKDDGSDPNEEENNKDKRKGKEEKECKSNKENVDLLNYGLSFASKGQDKLLGELDRVLESNCRFSVQRVTGKSKEGFLGASVAKDISPDDMKNYDSKKKMQEECGAYWTTLAPNVEEYSGNVARMIATGTGHLIKGILWCGDVTVDRLKWGNEVLVKRLKPNEEQAEISPETWKRIQRAKKMTQMTEKVASGVLSGAIKVSGMFSNSIANSTVGKKLLNLIPGEIVLASLDGFSKVCDAVEVAGKHVMSTSSTVTTDVVTHRYGEQAGHATEEGLGAAGHAFGTAWAVFKLRKALNPKSAIKASIMAKSAAKQTAEDYRSNSKGSK